MHPYYWKVRQSWERISWFSVTFPFFPPVHCIITKLFCTFSLFSASCFQSLWLCLVTVLWLMICGLRINWYLIWVMFIMFLSEDWCSVGVCLVSLPPLESVQVPILQVFESKPLRSGIGRFYLAYLEILCCNTVPFHVPEDTLLFWHRSEFLQILSGE